MSTGDFQAYVLNVALHGSILGTVVWAAVKCFKNPHARSLSAAWGLLAIAFIPWISAFQVPTEPVAWGKRVELPVSIAVPIQRGNRIIQRRWRIAGPFLRPRRNSPIHGFFWAAFGGRAVG